MYLLLIVLIVIALIGGGGYGYRAGWYAGPGGIAGLIVLILAIMLLFGLFR
jgi:hypothetical protein